MLEYCLRQERAKYHKLKFGVDPPNMGAPQDELKELNSDLEESLMSDSGGQTAVNWKQVFIQTLALYFKLFHSMIRSVTFKKFSVFQIKVLFNIQFLLNHSIVT